MKLEHRIIRAVIIGLWLSLMILTFSACSSGRGPTPSPAPAVTAPTESVPETGLFAPFQVAETVDALAFGMAPATDNTAALQAALGKGNRRVIVPAGDYIIGPVLVHSNTILVLQPGAILRDRGDLPFAEQLLNIRNVENVQVIGHGAQILADRADYSSGEFRHGLIINNSSNVSVEGIESSGHGGDGFYVGGSSHNVTLRGVLADNNRRNGLSIVSVTDMYVFDSQFNRTGGAAPEFGVDIEPNNSRDPIINVNLIRVATNGNRKAGIGVWLVAYDASAPVADVLIMGNTGGKYVTQGVRAQDQIRYIGGR